MTKLNCFIFFGIFLALKPRVVVFDKPCWLKRHQLFMGSKRVGDQSGCHERRRKKYGEIWAADPDRLGSRMSLGSIFVEISNGRDNLAIPAIGIR